jgi:hypothetical protein
MKQIILFSLIFLTTRQLKAQQQLYTGPSNIPIVQKEILTGTYMKYFTILSANKNRSDSSVKVEIVVHLMDSTNNNSPKRMEVMNKEFTIQYNEFPHHPPTRNDVVQQTATALGVQLIGSPQ